MGNLQELLDRTTINFPEEINSEETIKSIDYVGKQLNCNIEYDFKGQGRVMLDVGGKPLKQHYITELRCRISALSEEQKLLLTNFSFLEGEEVAMFSGVKIHSFPYGSLEEIPRDRLDFFDSVLEQFQNYFNQNPNQ